MKITVSVTIEVDDIFVKYKDTIKEVLTDELREDAISFAEDHLYEDSSFHNQLQQGKV